MRRHVVVALSAALAFTAGCGGGGGAANPPALTQGAGTGGTVPLAVHDKQLYSANQGAITVFDETTNKYATTVYETSKATCSSIDMYDLLLSADENTLYIAQTSSIPGLTGIAMFNTQTDTFEGVVPLPPGTSSVNHMILSADGKTIYGTTNAASFGSAVFSFDTTTNTFGTQTSVPYASSVAMDPTSGLLYVTGSIGGSPGGADSAVYAVVQVVNPAKSSIVATYNPYPTQPGTGDDIVLDSALGHIYMGYLSSNPDAVIADLNESTGAANDQIAPPAQQLNDLTSSNAVIFSSGNNRLYALACSCANSYLNVYNPSNDSLLTTIPLGSGTPSAAAISQDQQRIYVNVGTNIVAVNAAADSISATFPVSPQYPQQQAALAAQ